MTAAHLASDAEEALRRQAQREAEDQILSNMAQGVAIPMDKKSEETSSDPSLFDICDYLGARGDDFAERMDAERFLLLSESIDLHRVMPEKISTPALLMTAISDQLAPLPDMRELRDRLSGPSELAAAVMDEYDDALDRGLGELMVSRLLDPDLQD